MEIPSEVFEVLSETQAEALVARGISGDELLNNKRIYITSAYVNKKEAGSSVDMDENAPATYTSETMLENSANNSIPDSPENVNSGFEFIVDELSNEDLMMLKYLLSYCVKFIETYNKVWYKGKYVDAV